MTDPNKAAAPVRSFLSNLLVSILTSAILAGLGYLLSTRLEALRPYAAPMALVFGAVAGGMGVWVYIRGSKTRPRFDNLDFDFHVEAEKISYRYRDNRTIQYVKAKRIRALKNGLSVYPDKYHWTGAKPPSRVRSTMAGQTFRNAGRHTVWNHYEIELGRVLNKYEIVDTEVVWELDDSDRTSQPFVSATIEEPTKRLLFELVFPDDFGIKTITCNVLNSISAKKNLTSESRAVSQSGAASWSPEPPHPRLLHHYQVEWVWPATQPSNYEPTQ